MLFSSKKREAPAMFRILVVEDDKGTRRLMEDVLYDAGYEPLTADNGLPPWRCWIGSTWISSFWTL